MREITEHQVNEANQALALTAIEAPTGEPMTYKVSISHGPDVVFNFQIGPIKQVGVNGITNEVLLAIVADRLRFFQAHQFACRENALALTHIEEAQNWLHRRTLRRTTQGVEGYNRAGEGDRSFDAMGKVDHGKTDHHPV